MDEKKSPSKDSEKESLIGQIKFFIAAFFVLEGIYILFVAIFIVFPIMIPTIISRRLQKKKGFNSKILKIFQGCLLIIIGIILSPISYTFVFIFLICQFLYGFLCEVGVSLKSCTCCKRDLKKKRRSTVIPDVEELSRLSFENSPKREKELETQSDKPPSFQIEMAN